MTPPSCRLFVISAQAAATAIILRRGPSDWYHLIRWDMDHDTFQAGSWFRGRIYEEKCDLSPDGNLFLYFAFKHIHVGNQSVDSYTALSRAPWLHALVIWPQGTTYGGGGRFLGHRRIALRGVLGDPFPELPDGLEIVEGETDFHRSTEMTEVVAGADWCGRDYRGRSIYSIGGKLFRLAKNKSVELADFTNQHPNPQPPPELAQRPL